MCSLPPVEISLFKINTRSTENTQFVFLYNSWVTVYAFRVTRDIYRMSGNAKLYLLGTLVRHFH